MRTQGKNDRSKKEYETILTDKKKKNTNEKTKQHRENKNKTLRNNTQLGTRDYKTKTQMELDQTWEQKEFKEHKIN